MTLEGTSVGKKPPHARSRLGIAHVQEGKRIFRERTVYENLMLGTFVGHISRGERKERCDEMLDRFSNLAARVDQPAGRLSGGEQQMLAIAQALISRPRVLLLDEPSAGLAPAIVSEVFERLRELTATSEISILLAEQLAESAVKIADHVTVMDGGQVVADGPPQDFMDVGHLQAAYFGVF